MTKPALSEEMYLDQRMIQLKDLVSKNDLNTLKEYSAEEKIVGIWIDGKPVYRKVLTGTNNGSRDKSLPTPTDIDTMINMIVMVTNNNESITIPANTISYSTGNTPRGATYLRSTASWGANNIYIVEIADYTTIHAIIEYTKTTG